MNLERISIRAWILNHQIKTETGKPLDFYWHRYLRDIYTDNSKYLCALKSAQIGFSTMAILKTIWLARNFKMNIGYILPTVEMVNEFVGSKVNPLASQNPVISEWMKDKDSIKLKQIGENFIHYLGAQTEREMIMKSLDMIVGDEFDKAPQDVLEKADSRLQHSDYGYKWVFSNPTIPDFGVDRFWQLSDQKKWHITHHCKEKYIMDESCIDYVREEYVCPKCQGVISSEEIRMGEWIATATGEYSGYWIPLWINPKISAKTICEYKKTKTAEYFYNFVAGLPYVSAGNMLSADMLEKCLTASPNNQQSRTIIGLDTGHNLHYTMLNKEGIFYYGYCPSVEEMGRKEDYDPYTEIEQRLKEYPRSILVADQGGDLIGIRKLQAKYPGRVYLCWFSKETRSKQLIRWGENEEKGKVLADRNRVIQLIVDQMNEKRITFNGSREDWEDFFKHALNIYRIKEITGKDENDPQYGWRWVWKRKGPDHWFMSLVYGMIGLDKFSEDLAQIVKKDSFMADIPTGFYSDNITAKIIRGEKVDFI